MIQAAGYDSAFGSVLTLLSWGGWFLLVCAWTLVLYGASIIVHELGHAAAARLSGLRVRFLTVGRGPVLGRIGPVEIASNAFAGASLTVEHPDTALQDLLIALGGPAASITLAWIGLSFGHYPLLLANLPILVLSILPRGTGDSASDGRQAAVALGRIRLGGLRAEASKT